MKMSDFRIWFWAIPYLALASDHARNGAKQVSQNDENERLLNPVLSDSLYSFGAKQVSEITKINDFRTRFWAIPYVALVRSRCRKWRKWTIYSDSLYRFGAKEVSEMMKINDFRTRFSAIHYLALVRNRCRKWRKWTISEPGFEQFII